MTELTLNDFNGPLTVYPNGGKKPTHIQSVEQLFKKKLSLSNFAGRVTVYPSVKGEKPFTTDNIKQVLFKKTRTLSAQKDAAR